MTDKTSGLPTGPVVSTPDLKDIVVRFGDGCTEGPTVADGAFKLAHASRFIDIARHAETLSAMIFITPTHTIVAIRIFLQDHGNDPEVADDKPQVRMFTFRAHDVRVLNNNPTEVKK